MSFLNIVILVVASATLALCAKPEKFVNYAVYKIEARTIADAVITANKTRMMNPLMTNRTVVVTLDPYAELSSQKWRLDASSVYSAFELKLTSDERFSLEYVNEKGFFQWVNSLGFGNNRLWYFDDAGDGYVMIRNKHNDVCLVAPGSAGKPISAALCDNSFEQQWKLSKLN